MWIAAVPLFCTIAENISKRRQPSLPITPSASSHEPGAK